MSKKFKMPSAPTILFCICIFVAILTWFIPAGENVNGVYHTIASNKQGLSNIFYAPIKGFIESIDIGIYLMIMSGFISLVMKTGAISSGISYVTKKLQGKEILLIPLLMFLFSLFSTVLGFWEETLGFYILIVPVFIAAGYDAIVGLFVVMWGAGLGLIGSTVNPFATGIASTSAGLELGDGLILRLVLYVFLFALGTAYIMKYAKKIKAHPDKSLVFDLKKTHEELFITNTGSDTNITSTQKNVLLVFVMVFLVLLVGVLPWNNPFNIHFFDNVTQWIRSIPVLNDILGPIASPGNWKTLHLALLFFVASILVGFFGEFTEEEFINTFFQGVGDIMSVVFVIAIASGIKILMDDAHITATILYYGKCALSNLNGSILACATFLFHLPLTFLIPSSSGLAKLSIPLLAPLADFAGIGRDIIVTAYQTANGLVNLISPTSAVLMGALTITKIPYGVYLKSIFKLLIVIVIVLLLALYVSPLL